MKVNRLTTSGPTQSLTVSDVVFGADVNQVLISQAVRVYLANQRQGTSKVKTRSEINRTKKKWFKQKGTGNARHGARTPNIFVGGGVSHGPTGIQDWSLRLSSRMKRQALASALSAQVKKVYIADGLENVKTKTAQAVKVLSPLLNTDRRILVITEGVQENVLKSMRNLPSVLVMTATRVTALEVALADAIVMTEATVAALETRITNGQKAETQGKVRSTKTEVKAEKAKTETSAKSKTATKATTAKPKATSTKKTTATKAAPKKVAKK